MQQRRRFTISSKKPTKINRPLFEHRVNYIQLLLSGLATLALGIVLLIARVFFVEVATKLLIAIIAVNGLSQLFGAFTHGQRGRWLIAVASGVGTLSIAVFLVIFPKLPLAAVTIVFGAYTLFNAAVKLITYVTMRTDGDKKGRGWTLFESIVLLLFSGWILLFPFEHSDSVLILIGIYCILLAVTQFKDFLREVLPLKTKERLRRKVRITLPVFMVAFIPHKILNRLNRYLAGGEPVDPTTDLKESKIDTPPDMEVFVHVATSGFCAIGHVDIAFEGDLIAYGNYDDASSKRVPGFGDGVLILADPKKYIPFCMAYNKTTIFGFGLSLTEAQKESVRERIRQIKEMVIPWNPPYLDDLANGRPTKEHYEDFSSELARSVRSSFFKFTRSKFKTYFVLSTNCVLLADSIIGRAGTDLLGIGGIITPGTYYDYLESEYLKNDSIVTSRHIYKLDLPVVKKRKRKLHRTQREKS